MLPFTRDALGDERIAWLAALPPELVHPPMALVHASRESAWKSPWANATDAELESAYSPLRQPIVVYGHIHTPFVRKVGGLTVINSGAVSQPFDGDSRASYLLLDDGAPTIRRVTYDLEREIAEMHARKLPHAGWVERTLRTASPQMP